LTFGTWPYGEKPVVVLSTRPLVTRQYASGFVTSEYVIAA
jgi:hypothetical protein